MSGVVVVKILHGFSGSLAKTHLPVLVGRITNPAAVLGGDLGFGELFGASVLPQLPSTAL